MAFGQTGAVVFSSWRVACVAPGCGGKRPPAKRVVDAIAPTISDPRADEQTHSPSHWGARVWLVAARRNLHRNAIGAANLKPVREKSKGEVLTSLSCEPGSAGAACGD